MSLYLLSVDVRDRLYLPQIHSIGIYRLWLFSKDFQA